MKLARTPLEVGVTLAEAIERAMQAPARAYLCVDGAIVPAEGRRCRRCPPSRRFRR